MTKLEKKPFHYLSKEDQRWARYLYNRLDNCEELAELKFISEEIDRLIDKGNKIKESKLSKL